MKTKEERIYKCVEYSCEANCISIVSGGERKPHHCTLTGGNALWILCRIEREPEEAQKR